MAILANRTRSTNNLFEFVQFGIMMIKRLNIIIFIVLSIHLLYFAETKSLSNIALEATGRCISVSLMLYEQVINQINTITSKIKYLNDIESENIELKLEIARLKTQQSDMQSIRIENVILRKLLSVVKDIEYPYTTARLLTVSLTPFSHTAVVGAGRSHGIELDQIVTNGEWLIGRVVDVSDNYAKVILISDADSRIPVVSSISRERGILAGSNGRINMVYLQNNHIIQKDEKVVTSGDGAVYPPGIVVAKIAAIKQGRVMVESAVNLQKTDFVTIYSRRSKGELLLQSSGGDANPILKE
ncbi:rod shape-determining protein MreC [Candidatus Trichorickettsia mobilis]|uniref:rod shape-determining protein MreC n=1 Tax=Candidatus Trichorickettsia mobilis TaxID=1346319 RepID=UPI002931D7C8|nr:rod shape-determining protein MreC [Candidatus Trichorickettsia mobilis]